MVLGRKKCKSDLHHDASLLRLSVCVNIHQWHLSCYTLINFSILAVPPSTQKVINYENSMVLTRQHPSPGNNVWLLLVRNHRGELITPQAFYFYKFSGPLLRGDWNAFVLLPSAFSSPRYGYILIRYSGRLLRLPVPLIIARILLDA